MSKFGGVNSTIFDVLTFTEVPEPDKDGLIYDVYSSTVDDLGTHRKGRSALQFVKILTDGLPYYASSVAAVKEPLCKYLRPLFSKTGTVLCLAVSWLLVASHLEVTGMGWTEDSTVKDIVISFIRLGDLQITTTSSR